MPYEMAMPKPTVRRPQVTGRLARQKRKISPIRASMPNTISRAIAVGNEWLGGG